MNRDFFRTAAYSVPFLQVTVGMMCLLVTIGYFGLKLPVFSFLESYVHTASGLAIAGSGVAIQLVGI